MQNLTRLPNWLIGGAALWLVYALTLSTLHIWLLNQWGVSFTIQIYSLSTTEPIALPHMLLLGMVAPGFFTLDLLAFLHIHLPMLDAAIYNWRMMVLLSSLPAFIVGTLLTTHDRRLKLAGAILGLLLLGGCLLFVLNILLVR
jgi:hypothetical protein